MTVLETLGVPQENSKEPIKFPATREERRKELLRRRAEQERRKNARANESAPVLVPMPAPEDVVRPVDPTEAGAPKEGISLRRGLRISWTFISFLLMVAIPGAFTSAYFMVAASPQYMVETQFSVRGSSQSSMATFGLSGLFGSTVQSGDSYIVSSYIGSSQLVRDIKEQLGIDLRQYYAKNDIDFWYRIDPDMPLEKFTSYWKNMIEVSFNSTTGNTTLYVYAFSPDDSKAIADAVLKVSETLVNNLSENSRRQMTLVASKQVDRTEERLRKVREQVRKLRAEYKTIDPITMVKGTAALTQSLESQLQALKTRRATLLQSVDAQSPSARMLQKQIKAAEQELARQKSTIGSPDTNTNASVTKGPRDNGDVADVVNQFEELTVDQEFATKAYTTALAAFETALAEAQKQERYFATFIAPTRPEIALYPTRLLDSFITILVLLAVWMISQFLYRSFRDHAI